MPNTSVRAAAEGMPAADTTAPPVIDKDEIEAILCHARDLADTIALAAEQLDGRASPLIGAATLLAQQIETVLKNRESA